MSRDSVGRYWTIIFNNFIILNDLLDIYRICLEVEMVGEAGIEPTTPGLEGRCSIQLSYSPAVAVLRSTSLIVIGAAARKIASQASRAARVSAPQPAA